MVFQVLIIYFHNTFIILLYCHNTLSDIKKHHVVSAVLSICSVIPKLVLNFSLFTSTFYIVFRILYFLLLVCFAEIQATSVGVHLKTMLHHPKLQIFSVNRAVKHTD